MPDDGAEHRVPITQAAWAVPLEHGSPVRRFTSRKGQRHFSGLWWSATTGGHVGFESWLERDHLLNLDFDLTVVGIASQPFWLHWIDAAGKPDSHAPDFFARRSDGSAAVVVDWPAGGAAQAAGRREVRGDGTGLRAGGVEYRLLGAVDALVTANLRWLAGYRHPRHHLAETVDVLRRVFATPTPLMAGAAAAGDPIAVMHVSAAALRRRGESVVLVAYLMASPEFAVIDGAPTPSVEPFGLLEGLPVKALEQAREWERHIVEVETGLPPGPLPGVTPRAGFDPASVVRRSWPSRTAANTSAKSLLERVPVDYAAQRAGAASRPPHRRSRAAAAKQS